MGTCHLFIPHVSGPYPNRYPTSGRPKLVRKTLIQSSQLAKRLVQIGCGDVVLIGCNREGMECTTEGSRDTGLWLIRYVCLSAVTVAFEVEVEMQNASLKHTLEASLV